VCACVCVCVCVRVFVLLGLNQGLKKQRNEDLLI
jgi:hypothetical protein